MLLSLLIDIVVRVLSCRVYIHKQVIHFLFLVCRSFLKDFDEFVRFGVEECGDEISGWTCSVGFSAIRALALGTFSVIWSSARRWYSYMYPLIPLNASSMMLLMSMWRFLLLPFRVWDVQPKISASVSCCVCALDTMFSHCSKAGVPPRRE